MDHPFGYFQYYDKKTDEYVALIHETMGEVKANTEDELKSKIDEHIRGFYSDFPELKPNILNNFSYVRYRVIDIDTL